MTVTRVGDKIEKANEKTGAATQRNDAMAPSIKVTDMFAKCSSQGGWSGESADYLQEIRKIIEDPSRPMKATMHYISDDAVAFNTAEGNSVVLVRSDDIVNIQALAADAKFFIAREAFKVQFAGNKLLNIVSCNRFMFARHTQMAAYITQTLSAAQDEAIQDFNIGTFGNNNMIDINTDMTNVHQFFDNHSPSPTRCGDFGFIASVVDKSDVRFNNFQKNVPMFGVMGYVEFIRNEATGKFTPMVHVTEILSVLASSKILALALPLIGEVFIGRNLWRHPFSAVGKTDINIGNLLVNATEQKPYEVKSEADFRKLFSDWIDHPILCIDISAGAPSIPGINKITRPSDHHLLVEDIYNFLNMNPPMVDRIGANIFKEIIGVLETSKTSKFTNLVDSRDITYLWAVAKTKWSAKLEQLLTRNEADPAMRFEKLREIAGDITPTHSSITTLLYGDFIKDIAIAVSSNVAVNMPQSSDIPSIDFTGFSAKAYQAGANIFSQAGPSALISNGYMNW